MLTQKTSSRLFRKVYLHVCLKKAQKANIRAVSFDSKYNLQKSESLCCTSETNTGNLLYFDWKKREVEQQANNKGEKERKREDSAEKLGDWKYK